MSGRKHLYSVAVLCVMSVVAGCQSGSRRTASRNDSQIWAESGGRSRGTSSANRSSRLEVPALGSPQNAAYFREQQDEPMATSPRPQHTCPIDGNSLGQSGAPLTVTLKGEPIFVCCQSCAKKAQKDPDKYLARVRAETAARN